MNTSKEIFDELGVDKEVVIDFVLFFSRFEYALKRTPEYANGDQRGVSANWDRYASDHNSAFDAEADDVVKEAAEYLEVHSPNKQVLLHGVLDWKPLTFGTNQQLGRLLHIVRTARNNLFHGGKFPSGPYQDPARDEVLLKHCLTILEAALDLSDDVEDRFKESFAPPPPAA